MAEVLVSQAQASGYVRRLFFCETTALLVQAHTNIAGSFGDSHLALSQ